MTEARFGRVLTAMVTPFAKDGSLSIDGARKLATHLVDNGSDGIVVAGTTGESPVLSHSEKLDLFTAVLEEVGDLGVDAALVVTPYYSRPPQNGLLAHYRAVADASAIPLMLYDIPVRTGRRVEIETMVELAAHPNIVANKDAVGDAAETRKLRSALDAAGLKDFELYSGDDPMLIDHLEAGVVGIVSVCSHLIGPRIAQIVADHFAGKTDEARKTFDENLDFMRTIMGLTASPIPVKYATGLLGLDVGDPRLPNVPPTADEAKTIRNAMEKIGLL